MICQICQKHTATVHITEIPGGLPQLDSTAQATPIQERHICEPCARNLKLPSLPMAPKGLVNIWKLLQKSARKAREEGGLSCPECGMTLAEFRSKGRLGCPRDYEIFRQHLAPLLQRIHNASQHQGRLPGMDEKDLERRQALTTLRHKLEQAVRDEAYENAARLRDEIQQLEERFSVQGEG